MITIEQFQICSKYKVDPLEPLEGFKVGVSKNVREGVFPLNGLRHLPEGDTTGWYIWAGEELSADPEFFVPIHIEHLQDWRPEVLKYLAMPPGWRFLTADGYEDVWYDGELLKE